MVVELGHDWRVPRDVRRSSGCWSLAQPTGSAAGRRGQALTRCAAGSTTWVGAGLVEPEVARPVVPAAEDDQAGAGRGVVERGVDVAEDGEVDRRVDPVERGAGRSATSRASSRDPAALVPRFEQAVEPGRDRRREAREGGEEGAALHARLPRARGRRRGGRGPGGRRRPYASTTAARRPASPRGSVRNTGPSQRSWLPDEDGQRAAPRSEVGQGPQALAGRRRRRGAGGRRTRSRRRRRRGTGRRRG